MKLKVGLGIFVLLLLNIVTAHAQGLPCGGDDPDATCPLDTWVLILAIMASFFAYLQLSRRQKSRIPQNK